MAFLSSLALVLLSMVGYSAGQMIAGGKKKVTPSLFDLIVVVIMWGIALMTRVWIPNKWLALGLWIILGLVIGCVLGAVRRNTYPIEKMDKNVAPGVRGFKGLWERWKAFGVRMGNYQSRLLLALFYFPVVIPFGIVVRLSKDPFKRKVHQVGSRWVPRSKCDHDLESIQRQF
jgi:hypothetical protein